MKRIFESFMRILFLNYEYPPLGGGAGNATEYLMREFSKYPDLSIDIVTSSIDGKYSEESLSGDIRLYRVPIGDKRNTLKSQSAGELLRYTKKALALSRELVSKSHYDGIHAFFTIPCGAVAWWIGRTFHIPYIISLRGSDVPGYSKKYTVLYFFLKSFVRSIWRRSAFVVSNSEGLKFLANKTNSSQRIGVIYNGVDTQVFTPGNKGKEKDVFTVLCASRLESRKGFSYVVEAVAILREKYPHLQLILAGGDGDAGDDLRALVKEKNLSEVVKFFGQYTRKDLVRLQQETDVFILPSFNEGMSNSLLEAMAGGLPVIMTPTGGAEELVQEGENGYIVRFADARHIAEKLQLLLSDQLLTERMGKKSREVAEKMSWNAVAQEYRDLYKQAFSKKEQK